MEDKKERKHVVSVFLDSFEELRLDNGESRIISSLSEFDSPFVDLIRACHEVYDMDLMPNDFSYRFVRDGVSKISSHIDEILDGDFDFSDYIYQVSGDFSDEEVFDWFLSHLDRMALADDKVSDFINPGAFANSDQRSLFSMLRSYQYAEREAVADALIRSIMDIRARSPISSPSPEFLIESISNDIIVAENDGDSPKRYEVKNDAGKWSRMILSEVSDRAGLPEDSFLLEFVSDALEFVADYEFDSPDPVDPVEFLAEEKCGDIDSYVDIYNHALGRWIVSDPKRIELFNEFMMDCGYVSNSFSLMFPLRTAIADEEQQVAFRLYEELIDGDISAYVSYIQSDVLKREYSSKERSLGVSDESSPGL